MNKKNIILGLSLITNIGSGLIQKIVQQIGFDNLVDLYKFTVDDVVRLGLSHDRAQQLVDGLANQRILEVELAAIDEVGAQFMTPWCHEYPELLKAIEVPPAVLYYKGNARLFQNQKTIACVGARKAHSYVQDCLNKIMVPLIQNDWVVVSGGALGADTYAHNTALHYNGKTIVVIGGGLYHYYPRQNKKLFDQVLDAGGLIVSSFPIKMEPEARCFPMRNRIISGLSQGCLVLQAASKSGALITSQFSLEQGREVFAVPGPIYDPLSAGCHDLIKQGAKLVVESQDILDELEGLHLSQLEFRQPKVVQKSFIPAKRLDPISNTTQYDEAEQLILQYTVQPVSIDDLLTKTHLTASILHDKLFSLSLDGKIEQNAMGLWQRR